METLRNLQHAITQARAHLAAADEAYYQSLQRWALSHQGGDQIEPLRQQRRDAQASLDAALGRLVLLGEPQTLVEQLPADVPVLLLPVRVEARYLSVRHVVRHLNPAHVVDAGAMPLVANYFRNRGFHTHEEGAVTYQVPALHLSDLPGFFADVPLRHAAVRVKSGQFIPRMPDREELWVRIYPDEIFTEALEKNLQTAELEAGRAFWAKIWAGDNAEDAWLQLTEGTTIPRAAWIVQTTRPTNYRPGVALAGTPVFPEVLLKDGPYTRPPVARLLPERFVVRLEKNGHILEMVGKPVPEPLALGLDPTLDPLNTDTTSTFTPDGARLKAPAPLQWVHDLHAAEESGLAIRVDLVQHPQFAEGVDTLVVLGAKLSADSVEGARLLEAHFENCLYKEDGLGILPQGTPTNNFAERQDASTQRDAEARQYFRAIWSPPTAAEADEARVRAALGLRRTLHFPNGHVTDVHEALQMNRLLWPATFGYYLLQFFTPALADATREQVRQFFTNYVSGRGLLPVLRLNRQPYGIIPTTSFTHWTYASATGEDQFLTDLWGHYLATLHRQWHTMTAGLMAVLNTDTSGQRLDETFLRMLGHDASSVQVHKQTLIGAGFMEVLRSIQPLAITELEHDPDFTPAARGSALTAAGLGATNFKALTESYFSGPHRRRIGSFTTDGLPLSEERGLQHLPQKSWNYLQWLAEARLEHIWRLDFSEAPSGDAPLDGNAAAETLLSRLSRQAVLRTYLETGLRHTEPHPGLWLLKAKNFEPEHLHDGPIPVDPAALAPNNALHQLYRPIIEQFGLNTPFSLAPDRWAYLQPIADTLDHPGTDPTLQAIAQLKATLAHLSQLPTARLDRLFTEHLDLCSHRLDAWLLGLLHHRVDKLRTTHPTGIGIGAFGYLLGLKPNPQRPVVVVDVVPDYLPATSGNMHLAAIPIAHLDAAQQHGISPDQNWDRTFFYLGTQTNPSIQLNRNTGQVEPEDAVNDATSHGFLHAPSPAHAVAAAVLRAGYLNHKNDMQSDALAIALNAPRTRLALQLLDGIQQGASLAELLGYYLERSLHEHHLDAFLHDIRQAYPLRRSTEATAAQTQLLTTTDGLAVVEAFHTSPVPDLLNAVAVSVREIDDRLDAVGDLLLAESVFQTAKGNTDRAAAALRVLNSGGQVVPPEFIRTPHNGAVIHHRIAMVFAQRAAREPGNVWTDTASPRTALCPALNRWLARQLPQPSEISIALMLPDGSRRKLTLAQLDLEPCDFLHACPAAFEHAEHSRLALLAHVRARGRFDVAQLETDLEAQGQSVPPVRIDFQDRTDFLPHELSVFEVSAQVTALQNMVATSRFLAPHDFRVPDARAANDDRIDPVHLHSALTALRGDEGPLANAAKALRERAADLRAAMEANIPLRVRRALEHLQEAFFQGWLVGMEDAAGGDPFAHTADNHRILLQRADKTAGDVEARLVRLGALLDALPADLAGAPLFQRLEEATTSVFGRAFRLFPDIRLENAAEVDTARAGQAFLQHAAPHEVDDWLRDAALARQPIRAYRQVMLMREAFQTAGEGKHPDIIQLPFHPGRPQPWIGGPFAVDRAAAEEEMALVSLLLETPDALNLHEALSGMVLDEWPEFVPSTTADTGVAFHYNQPNTEPPQTMLLAVPPVEGAHWHWDYLMGAVLEALALAQKRLITPEHIAAQNAGLAQVLPGIILPVTPENNQTPTVDVS